VRNIARVNNKWENEESWNYHIKNKNLIREVIDSDNEEDLQKLATLTWDDKWLINEGEGDPPNMDFIRRLHTDYMAWAEKNMPLLEKVWLPLTAKKIVSLYRQDSAYAERIGGVIVWIQYNEALWKKCKTKKEKIEFLESARDWWNENDTRDRTRGWILHAWNKIIGWYGKKEFWERSVNFLVNWTIEHKNDWQPNQMYDPKVWFPRGRGHINNLVHGGRA